jgi:Tol biopolymer transport system component
MRHTFFVAALLASACTVDSPSAPAPAELQRTPVSEILDAAHNFGTSHFYFLPPMVAAPSATGVFDAAIQPVVEICIWSSGCHSLVARYTLASGVAGQTVRLNTNEQNYSVNWQTDQFSLDLSQTYRISVKVATTELGHSDVMLFNNGKDAKNAATGDIITLVDGRTLPIKFRIERGAVALIGAIGGTAALADGKVNLTFPSGAVTSSIGVTATPVSNTVTRDASVLLGSLFEFQPSPITFADSVQLSLSYGTLPSGWRSDRIALCKVSSLGACRPIIPSVVDPVRRTVSGSIGGFSEYAVTKFPEMSYRGEAGQYFLHTARGEIPLLASGDPIWSPDGSRYMYLPDGNSTQLHVANADGSGDRVVFETSHNLQRPSWSPDGHKIVFNEDYGLISVVDVDQSTVTSYPTVPRPDHVQWLANGTRLSFINNTGEARGIYVMNADGTDVRKIIQAYGFDFDRFAWSKDETILAFIGDFEEDISIGPQLYFVNPDGTNLRKVTPAPWIDNPSGQLVMDWSPVAGDNRLAFTLEGWDPFEPRANGLYVINADGVATRIYNPYALGSVGTDFDNPRWSPDGTRVAFDDPCSVIDVSTGCGNGTYVINGDGTGIQRVVPFPRARWKP